MSTSGRPPPHEAHRLDPPAPNPDDIVPLTLPATLIACSPSISLMLISSLPSRSCVLYVPICSFYGEPDLLV
uniref:Uncharacterized protein n=1 Tax=Triticum urartu TaxID=4572 RepID=A0A8R7K0M5_TRIUA